MSIQTALLTGSFIIVYDEEYDECTVCTGLQALCNSNTVSYIQNTFIENIKCNAIGVTHVSVSGIPYALGYNPILRAHKYIPEKRKCCWKDCEGNLLNISLIQRFEKKYDHCFTYNYSPLINTIINNKHRVYFDSQSPDVKYDSYYSNCSNNALCDYPDDCDQIICDKCSEYYVVCLKCKAPCIIKSHSGYFCSSKYGKINDIWLGRNIELPVIINSNVSAITEHITIFENNKKVPVEELNPTQNPNIIIEDKCATTEEDDLYNCFNIIDKRIIWSCDPRLNLHINNDIYVPMFTGPDGGFGVTYWCDTCQIDYGFNDK